MLDSFATIALDSSLNQWIGEAWWLWPILEIIHFIGLSLMLGGLLIVDLRLAGHIRGLDPERTHKLLPLVLLGFALNLVTGIQFFFGDPLRYAVNIGFQIKMLLIMLGGANALFYHVMVDQQVRLRVADGNSPLVAKCVAYTSLGTWTAVLLFGRLIPYIGSG